ncbi:MAG TPA: hypothetical protein VMW72_09600 [Sedimentisphaerales bacterium]|nr:hypothetical protein [Sedimentisphaerales bacterium]
MMKEITAIILMSISIIVPVLAQQSEQDIPTVQPKVRFAPLHIYLDSGSKSLAAYQFELKATAGQIKIVGVEGGQHKAFKEAPYYDPAALANDRIIIAAFNTGRELPTGRTRIATIHLQIIDEAEPDYELKLTVAADVDAKEIPAKISFEKGE